MVLLAKESDLVDKRISEESGTPKDIIFKVILGS